MAHTTAPIEESLLSKIEQRAAVIFVKGGVLPWFLIVAVLIFWLSTENFLSGRNILSMLRQATYLTMVSMAQMVVLLTAGLDLSVGVMFAITSVISSMDFASSIGCVGCLPLSLSWRPAAILSRAPRPGIMRAPTHSR